MKCFYHQSDLDGQCSGAIIKLAHPECQLIPIDYGHDFKIKSYKGQTIFMVDFTLQPMSLMISLNKVADLIWIDHHNTSINSAKEKGFNPEGVRDNSMAACELTWKYCFPNEEMPRFVKLLGRYDIWDHNHGGIIEFQYGMKGLDTNPESDIWNSLFTDDEAITLQITQKGESIYNYVQEHNRRYANSFSFETNLEGLACICCNRGVTSSIMFDSVWDEKRHDMMVTFCRTPSKRWLVSLYTTHSGVDCGKIAKKYGGGGHQQAAGFRCKELPFNI